jgi:hypothetical protein
LSAESRFRNVKNALAVAVMAAAVPVGAQPTPATLGDLLDRVGQRVESYFARAASIVAIEKVMMQPVRRDWMSDGVPRRLVFELRLAWEPPAEAGTMPEVRILRQLVSVNGRAPQKRDEKEGCLDPKAVSGEPLQFLLAGRRGENAFSMAGTTRIDGRTTVIVDYRSTEPKVPPTITWTRDDCGSIEMPGRTRGRIWVDAETGDVLRHDEGIQSVAEVRVPAQKQRLGFEPTLRVERADSSTRYKFFAFTEPDELLLLPSSVETMTVIVGSGTPQRRTVHTYSDYKRFLTGGRVVQ